MRRHRYFGPLVGRAARRLVSATALAVTAGVVLSGCGSSAPASAKQPGVIAQSLGSSSPWRGTVLGTVYPEPAVALTDTATGAPYDVPARTKGQVVLLYFGYTHCPDVCPTTMAGIAASVRELPAVERGKVAVLFVTTDPTHDTPAVINAWLAHFASGASLVGLTGAFPVIQRLGGEYGIDVEPAVVEKDGTIEAAHGAEVLAFSLDGKAHAVYVQVPVGDYAHDLPMLLAGKIPQ